MDPRHWRWSWQGSSTILLIYMRQIPLNSLDHLGAIPFRRPGIACNLATVPIEQQGRGHTDHAELGSCLGGRIDVDRQRADVDLVEEALDHRLAAAIDR